MYSEHKKTYSNGWTWYNTITMIMFFTLMGLGGWSLHQKSKMITEQATTIRNFAAEIQGLHQNCLGMSLPQNLPGEIKNNSDGAMRKLINRKSKLLVKQPPHQSIIMEPCPGRDC